MIDITEGIALGTEAAELLVEIVADLRKDDDGVVRLTKAEWRNVRHKLLTLAAHVARDVLD